MKKSYISPALRKSKLQPMTLLAGSIIVNTDKSTDVQYSKPATIFDSVFSPEDENEE